MSSDFAIQVAGVSKSYRIYRRPSHRFWQFFAAKRKAFYDEFKVLDDISFNVARGETVGIVGRNGSGKSTLLGLVCGTLTPTDGEIRTEGKIAALLELGAGFNPELTGRENIELSAQIYGIPVEQFHEKQELIINFADIGAHIDQPVKTYSSGMFTRLAFAVIAHVDADILVVDEALSVGDAFFVQKCMRFISEYTAKGGTLLFVSHDMGSVTALCDRAILINNGRVALDDTPKRVAQRYLADLYEMPTSDSVQASADPLPRERRTKVDPRQEILRNSNIRNDLKVLDFKPGHDFGIGGASFERVEFLGANGSPLSWVIGGEQVRISMDVATEVPLKDVIIGFVLKDRNGQPIFGDNTYLTRMDDPLRTEAKDRIHAEFEFCMPIMPAGDYAVSVAVSEGQQSAHVVRQWIHDAVIISSQSTSVSTGLVGIPMTRVDIHKVSPDQAGM